jgi:hypothetical protein
MIVYDAIHSVSYDYYEEKSLLEQSVLIELKRNLNTYIINYD